MRYKALLASGDLLAVPLGLTQSISAGVAGALAELLQVGQHTLHSRAQATTTTYLLQVACCRTQIVIVVFLLPSAYSQWFEHCEVQKPHTPQEPQKDS